MSSKAKAPVVWMGSLAIDYVNLPATPRINVDPVSVPVVHMSVNVPKETLFDRPFVYSLITNANGVVMDYAASGLITASSAVLKNILGGNNVSWSASGYTTNFVFNGRQFSRLTIPTSVPSDAKPIGYHILSIALQAVEAKTDQSIYDRADGMAELVDSLSSMVVDTLMDHLTLPVSQVNLINTFIQVNGPVVNANALASKVREFLVTSSMRDMTLGFYIREIPLVFSFSGQLRNLTLKDIPILIQLT